MVEASQSLNRGASSYLRCLSVGDNSPGIMQEGQLEAAINRKLNGWAEFKISQVGRTP
jgi:hypothetical protein